MSALPKIRPGLTVLLLAVLLMLMSACQSQAQPQGERPPPSAGAGSASPRAVQDPSTKIPLIDAAGRDFAERRIMDVYRQVSPSVVTVTTTVLQPSFFFEPIPAEGTGSGFVIDGDGRIVTNFHVVEGARRVEVTFADGTSARADVVGVDPPNDLAVLQVDAPETELVAAPLGTSAGLAVGQRAIAIGNPFGEFGLTLTAGSISAVDRTLRGSAGHDITGVIQTDAAINRGNSGGPLLDSAGNVIGINTAIFSPSGTNAGLGFAIPVDTVRRVLPELIEFGRYRHPWLGINAAYSLTPGLARALGLATDSGLLLVQLQPDSPLERAGIQGAQRQLVLGNQRVYVGGDIVTAVDGESISTRAELRTLLETDYRVGDQVTVTVMSDDGEREVQLTLAEQVQ